MNRRKDIKHENELNFSIIESVLLLCCLLLLSMPLLRLSPLFSLFYSFAVLSITLVHLVFHTNEHWKKRKDEKSFFSALTSAQTFRVAIVFSWYRRAYTIHRSQSRQPHFRSAPKTVCEPLASTVPHSFVHSRSVRIVCATQFDTLALCEDC